jgi:hypothetical protein
MSMGDPHNAAFSGSFMKVPEKPQSSKGEIVLSAGLISDQPHSSNTTGDARLELTGGISRQILDRLARSPILSDDRCVAKEPLHNLVTEVAKAS